VTTSDQAADQAADEAADPVDDQAAEPRDTAPDSAPAPGPDASAFERPPAPSPDGPAPSPNPFAPPSSWAATPSSSSAAAAPSPTTPHTLANARPDPFAMPTAQAVPPLTDPAPDPYAGDPWSAPTPWPSSDRAASATTTSNPTAPFSAEHLDPLAPQTPLDPPATLDPLATLDSPAPSDSLSPLDASPAPRPRTRARRGLRVGIVVPLVVLSLVAGAAGGVIAVRVLDDGRPADAGLPAVAAAAANGTVRPAGSVAGIAAAVLPSVVSIRVEGADGTFTGSGLVLRQDGYLLTNNHVVASGAADGATITVLFVDGTEAPATIVGRTGAYDLAVIKVDRTGLVPLLLGNSDDVAVGDPVVAVGAPLGLKGTVTTGIISALNRPVSAGDASDTAFINAIQTDAAINPGNSGGPLVNSAGEVVGINSAIAQPPGSGTAASGSIGLGFAIPSNQARRTAAQLIETGRATYPIVGVLLDQTYTGEGVQVASAPVGGQDPVSVKGPADKAGIRSGDVILTFDGRPMTETDELIVSIRAKAPGDTVTLRVRTGDQPPRDVRVVLDEATSQ